jgi:alkaline phosphatase D
VALGKKGTLDRRGLLKGAAAVTGGVLVGPALPAPALTHGVASGDVTSHSAVIWARASRPAHLQVAFAQDMDGLRRGRHSRTVKLLAEHDCAGQVSIRNLDPNTPYFYQATVRDRGEGMRSQVGSFVTAPDPSESADVRFAWGADVGQGMNNRPPFPAFASIGADDPAFFVFCGDTIYGDTTTPAGPPATTIEGYWAKYKENRTDPYFQALLDTVPVVVTWDDHEVTNDFRGPHGDAAELLPIGLQAFHDYWPVSEGPTRIYRSLRWGREVELFVLDVRQYADPLATPDGPQKTNLGNEQRKWLVQGVLASDATWKVIITSSPLSILRDVTRGLHDDWANYEYELGSLLSAWQRGGVRNLVWLTADVHWAQAIEYPSFGMWEFVGAPIGANPRSTALPLSPTFGPISHFLGLNERYYGLVDVNAKKGIMTVRLKLANGQIKHETVIHAE